MVKTSFKNRGRASNIGKELEGQSLLIIQFIIEHIKVNTVELFSDKKT